MTQYQFLTDDWLDASRALREKYRDSLPVVPVVVRMNHVVTGVPFGEGVVRTHLDTSDGRVHVETGHLEQPDLTVTLDYETARSLLVGSDPAAAMTAFMSGRMKVDGDITKLIALQTAGAAQAGGVDPKAAEFVSRLQDLTA